MNQIDHSFIVLFLINFCISLGLSVFNTYFSAYLYSEGVQGLLFAVTVGSYAITKVFINPLAGFLYDRFDGRFLLVSSVAFFVFAAFCYMINTSVHLLVFIRIIQGVGMAVLQPVLLSLIGQMAPKNKIALTLSSFDISFYLAGAIGPVIGGAINDRYTFYGNIFAFFSLCMFSLILSLFYFKNFKELRISNKGFKIQFHKILSLRMTALLAYTFGEYFSTSILFVFMPILLLKNLQFSGFNTGIIMSMSAFVMIVFLIPMGRFADKHNRFLILTFVGPLFYVLIFAISFIDSFAGVLCLYLGIGISNSITRPASSSLLIEEGYKKGMGKSTGAYKSAQNLGYALAPFLGTFVYSKFGLQNVFIFTGAVGLTTVFIFYICHSKFNLKPR